ncbi:MAG: site-specific DNA-methyltransferase [Endomicrobium sp.]|jgi:adenine-specific DNA-methyltransferase|nr:site-specific DNA-methyltransferase [Endomicrobium sp.]
MTKEEFIQQGFNVIKEEKGNALLSFLQQNYPSVIKDDEINLTELKSAAGLPVDDKVNGYGLNFIGRNVAKAKYAQKTDKALKINNAFSRDFDKTQNMVIKGDNLDALKLLKSHYSGQIKCIYIDPPYNTDSESFVYPDKFNKEEAEVLGLANITETDMERLEFSFKSKKSHNGWLSFMYPRLMLARDLLSDDGVIFISIDDNEQANLKLLCDDIFGENNFVSNSILVNNRGGRDYGGIAKQHEYILIYAKSGEDELNLIEEQDKKFQYEDEIGGFNLMELRNRNVKFNDKNRPNLCYPFFVNPNNKDKNSLLEIALEAKDGFIEVMPAKSQGIQTVWRWGKEEKSRQNLNKEIFGKENQNGGYMVVQKYRKTTKMQRSIWDDKEFVNERGTEALKELFGESSFPYPKSVFTIKRVLELATSKTSTILDFFAGSGTTGHAVMELNAEDGGNRKFILCQIDEPIKEDKPAYKFCEDNHLPPVISSITCERLNRAGNKIKAETGKDIDIGYKVFDLTQSPHLTLNADNQAELFDNKELTPLDRI